MKICKEPLIPLAVFTELWNADIFSEGLCLLNKSKSERKRLSGYMKTVSVLTYTGQTLGEYLTEQVIYSKSPLLKKIAEQPTKQRTDVLERDLNNLAAIVREYRCEAVKSALSVIDGAKADYSLLPDYESGSFDLTAEKLLEHIGTHGFGDFAKYHAFTYRGSLVPVKTTDPIRLSDLKNYDFQRKQVVENTEAFLKGLPAQNVLLYGDRGCGKSSTVKALLNEFDELRLCELPMSEIEHLPQLFGELAQSSMRFIVMIDDLSFYEDDERFTILKATLDGSIAAAPDNVLIYATTNRRKLIRETNGDRSVDDIGRSDAVDESMSLADRFGLFVTFTQPNRDVYLDIVKKLAADRQLGVDEEKLLKAAESFALRRGGRSPRIARQFVDSVIVKIKQGSDF